MTQIFSVTDVLLLFLFCFSDSSSNMFDEFFSKTHVSFAGELLLLAGAASAASTAGAN